MTVIETIYPFLPLLQYPGTVLTVAAYFLVGSKDANNRKYGFEMGLVGNIVWVMYAIWGNQPAAWGLVITNVAIFVGGLRGRHNNSENISEEELDYMRKNGLIP